MIGSLHRVTKIYDGIVVGVSEVDFEIPAGITGFLGPNGAGKSTCIKLLAGELRPTVGKVKLLGENPWNNPSIQKQIAHISEINSQFDFLTPFKLLNYLGKLYGASSNEAKKSTLHSLTTLGMNEFRNRRLNALSKGMKQRTKIAAALMFPREFILADEPLSGLDPFGRNLVLNLFRDLAEQGTSILISSHILFEVEKFTDRMILIYNGQIVATGKTSVIRKKLTDFPYSFKIKTSNHAKLGSLLLAENNLIQSLEVLPKQNKNFTDLIITTTKPSVFQDFIMKTAASDSDITIFEIKNIENEKATEAIFDFLIN